MKNPHLNGKKVPIHSSAVLLSKYDLMGDEMWRDEGGRSKRDVVAGYSSWTPKYNVCILFLYFHTVTS